MSITSLGNKLATRFAVLLAITLLITISIYSLWSNADQQRASEQKVLEEARLLSQQMAASWDYVDSIQDYINYNSDGRYDFKGVYCSVAGKSIALRFTQATDCVIRYTRENPRSGNDAPDSFESQALASFAQGNREFYGVTDYEGQQVFRYVSALEVRYGCLSCHGNPAGELDETGYPKEGMAQGDLAGAVSLIIPMDQYQIEATSRTSSNIMLFVVLAVVIVGVMSVALHRWVTKPLSALSAATREVGSGRFDNSSQSVQASCEIAELAVEFSSMEAQLKDFYGRLEQEVQTRTAELIEANQQLDERREEIRSINDQLVEANRLLRQENEFQSTFLSTMSHELRTPIASIIAYTNVWLRSSSEKTPEDIELMQEIKRSSKTLLNTINNTLDAASIEAQRFPVNIVPVDLLDVINEAESVIRPLAEERNLDFTVCADAGLPLVEIDPDIMRKILVNLLSNAVKFTDSGGNITLEVSADKENKRIIAIVQDSGIGIPADDLKLIFERFRQADSSISRKYGGSGLGLSLVREMTELLGGYVSVESKQGSGSRFEIDLPYRPLIEDAEGEL